MVMIIVSATVFLDENPDYMDGIFRIQEVITFNESGDEVDSGIDFIDNTEYTNINSLLMDVAGKLQISIDAIEIDN